MADSKIVIEADVSGVHQGVNQAKKSLHNLADTAQSAGRRGADGVARIGDGALQTAKAAEQAKRRIERSSTALENSIKRDIAMLQAGGKASREYYEALAGQRGLDKAKFEPLFKQLDALNAKTNQATLTQRQYNNALRQVPLQMTDIVTQLAGGQNPLLVALQQGGQLRDSFGGFGMMFKGIASAVSPTKLAIGGLAGGVGALALAMYKGGEESRAYEKALILTGERAGVTADYLQDTVAQVGKMTGGYAQSREAVLAFAKSGGIAAADYTRFTQSVVLQSQATGQSVEDLAAKYTDIAKDPLKAVVELSKTYRSMTAGVYDQVKALQEQGREQEAAALVMGKYSAESDAMSERVLENLGLIDKAWKGIKESAASAWEGMKNIGRDPTLQDRLKYAEAELAKAKQPGLTAQGAFGFSRYTPEQIKKLESDVANLRNLLNIEDSAAWGDKYFADVQKNQIAGRQGLDRVSEKYASREEQRKRELIALENDYKKAIDGTTAAERKRLTEQYRKNKARINEAYKEKPAKTVLDGLEPNQKRLYQLAKSAGEDPAKWLALYQIESGSGKDLKNETSGAMGHFQVMPQYLRDYGLTESGANDLDKSFHAVLRHHERGSRNLRRKLGRELTAGEYYLGHQQGWGGAAALLANPDKNVVDALSTIMSRGKAQASVKQNGGRVNMTARQFADQWIGKVDKLYRGFAEKGIGSLDSPGMAGIGAFEPTQFDKFFESIQQRMDKARLQMSLSAQNYGKTITEQLNLLSSPEFAAWDEKQQQAALNKAKEADAQADVNEQTRQYAQLVESIAGRQAVIEHEKHVAMLKRAWQEGKISQEQYQKALLNLKTPEQLIDQSSVFGGMEDGLKNYVGTFDSMRKMTSDLVAGSLGEMENALASFVTTGEANFKKMTQSMLADISRVFLRMSVMQGLGALGVGGIPALPFADGGAFSRGVQFFADGGAFTNRIVSKPTMFAHGGGFGVMGEAGPEAIMPLTRAPNGKLGVTAMGGGGANVNIQITVNNGAGEIGGDGGGRGLASAVKAVVEDWYYHNVARPGGAYHKG